MTKEEIKATQLLKKYHSTSKGNSSDYSAKINAIHECKSLIDEILWIQNETMDVHLSLGSPKKLTKDIYNPRISFYESVIKVLNA